jgi:hypothetical protein
LGKTRAEQEGLAAFIAMLLQDRRRLEALGLRLFERGDVGHRYGSFYVYRKRDFLYMSDVTCIEILNFFAAEPHNRLSAQSSCPWG